MYDNKPIEILANDIKQLRSMRASATTPTAMLEWTTHWVEMMLDTNAPAAFALLNEPKLADLTLKYQNANKQLVLYDKESREYIACESEINAITSEIIDILNA